MTAHHAACPCCRPGLDRRRLFVAGGAGLAALSFAGRLWAAPPPTTLSPDEALAALMAGNARFMAGTLDSFQQDLAALRKGTEKGQAPFAAVLACADSRVPVELVFDQSIGGLFVVRVAGNVATAEVIASLEYAAAVLGVRAMMVVGHEGCGAVKATIEGHDEPGQITTLYRPIRPAVEKAGPDLTAVIKANAAIQADLLATASPLLAGQIRASKLKIVPAYYDFGTGKVSVL